MSADIVTNDTADPDGRWLYRVGGFSALAISAAYVVIFGLFAKVGAPPGVGDGAVWLAYLSGKTTVWWAILGLSVFTDCLLVPVALALYLALRRLHANAMLVAAAFTGLFIVLDLAVTWTNYASLLTLSRSYDAATTGPQRAISVAAATVPSALLTSPLLGVYAIVLFSFGILVTGFVMLKGVFSRTTAYVGVVTGILGIASLTGLSATVIMNAMFATLWLGLVGLRLGRLGQE
jgi:hypothetical protein